MAKMSSAFVCPEFKTYSVQKFDGAFCFWQYGKETIDKATNNRAETLAILMAVSYYRSLGTKSPLIIKTDSELLKNTFNTWMMRWERRKQWHKKRNPDLIKTLFNLKTPLMECEWLRGHGGNEYNEICDYLCTKALRGETNIQFRDWKRNDDVINDVIKNIKSSNIIEQKKETQCSLF